MTTAFQSLNFKRQSVNNLKKQLTVWSTLNGDRS